MAIFLILLGITIVVGLGPRKNNETILSIEDTETINGIFVVLIFLSHSTQYFELSTNFADFLYRKVQFGFNQWVVTTFLAFSGYGVMVKMKMGGVSYLQKFPQNRLLKTLINFDIAVVIYLIVNAVLGIHYDGVNIMGSFIGLTSVGNSNWYIFTILLMYLISYLAAVILKSNYKGVAGAVTICAILYVVIAHMIGLPSRFVSTVATYAIGMWIALYREKIIKVFRKKAILSLIVILIPIVATYRLRGNDYIMNLNSCFFVLLVVWFLAHFVIDSKILLFLGKHAFSIYILQRLPMMIWSHFYEPFGIMTYVFVSGTLVMTIAIAVVFDKAMNWVDEMIVMH